MDEIDIKDLLSYFLSRMIYFLVIVTIVVTLGCIYSVFVQKPIYTSKTSVILTGFSGNTESSEITQSDLTVNSKLVSTYKEVVKSRRVLNQVILDLDLDYDIKEISDMIHVGAIKDTAIIEIAISHEDSEKAYIIANKVAEIFSKEVKDLYNLSNVSILDYAEIETIPSNINITKQLAIYLAGGLALAFVILFLFYYFDTTIKSVPDVERKFELPILGSVPDYNKKKGSSRRWKMK